MSTRMPPWATKTVNTYENQGDSTFVTSTRQSANLFRIECARIWHQRIHQAQRKAWTRTVQDMLEYKAKENAMVESTTAQLEHYSLTPSGPNEYDRHFEEDFLPMTIVSPPPACRLDRQALTEAMWDLYRGGRCCSLWLPRLLSTTHSTLHLLARQCVSIPAPSDQEFQNQASRYFRKHQRKRHASMKQILLWWAARTKAFDSMVIVLEDPGGFAESKVWNDFVATLQEFRQEHGLPVSLVVVGHVPVHGDMRLRLRYVKACQTTWMKVFWQELGNKSKTPLPVSSIDRLTQVVHNYRLEHQSMTRLCEDLLTNVTVFFAHPSRFIWNGLELHPSFLAWFHVHGTAKRWLSTAPGSTKYTALAKCQRLQNQLQWWWNWQTKLLPLVLSPNDDEEFLGYLQPLAELFSSLTDTVAISCLPPTLERYLDRTGNRKMDETKSESNSFSLQQQQARTLLYELIILLGHANKETNEAHDGRTMLTVQDKTEGIRRMIHDLFEFVIQSMDAVICDWDQCNPLAKTLSKKSGQSDGEVTLSGHHHRHDLVGGLISPSKELFGLLQDRLSISREEWFYQFGGSAQDFVRGLWTLVILGLVQAKWKRLGTGNTVYYEKVSVVWC